MANSFHDQNHVPVLMATSNVDGSTPVLVWADPVTHRLLVTGTGGSGSGFQQPLSGLVNGLNTTYTWSTAPNAISVDNGRVIQQVSSDGTVNWTGTTTTVLAVAPDYDIFAVA